MPKWFPLQAPLILSGLPRAPLFVANGGTWYSDPPPANIRLTMRARRRDWPSQQVSGLTLGLSNSCFHSLLRNTQFIHRSHKIAFKSHEVTFSANELKKRCALRRLALLHHHDTPELLAKFLKSQCHCMFTMSSR